MGIIEVFTRSKQQFIERVGKLKSSVPNTPLSPEASDIISALENPQYNWRTIKGVVEETGLDFERVYNALISPELQSIIVHPRSRDQAGRDLYSTRGHYMRTRGIVNRFLDSAAGIIR